MFDSILENTEVRSKAYLSPADLLPFHSVEGLAPILASVSFPCALCRTPSTQLPRGTRDILRATLILSFPFAVHGVYHPWISVIYKMERNEKDVWWPSAMGCRVPAIAGSRLFHDNELTPV